MGDWPDPDACRLLLRLLLAEHKGGREARKAELLKWWDEPYINRKKTNSG